MPAPPPESEPAMVTAIAVMAVPSHAFARVEPLGKTRLGLAADSTSEMTATLSAPASQQIGARSSEMPPIATSGLFATRFHSVSSSGPLSGAASSLETVDQIGPSAM